MQRNLNLKTWAGMLTLLLLTAGATTTKAQTFSTTSPEVVGLGGEVLFSLRAANDLDKTAKQRADDCYDRLRNILNNANFKSTDIQVKPLGNYGAKIVANGELIIPVGMGEARENNTDPMTLAKEWARNLRRVLPMLTARPEMTRMAYASAPAPSSISRR